MSKFKILRKISQLISVTGFRRIIDFFNHYALPIGIRTDCYTKQYVPPLIKLEVATEILRCTPASNWSARISDMNRSKVYRLNFSIIISIMNTYFFKQDFLTHLFGRAAHRFRNRSPRLAPGPTNSRCRSRWTETVMTALIFKEFKNSTLSPRKIVNFSAFSWISSCKTLKIRVLSIDFCPKLR